jgi:DNA-binding NtrC family response regulator
VTLEVPPLRDRRDDIVPLATFFLGRARRDGPCAFTEAATDALLRHAWPGNVRELKSTIERADLLSRGEVVDARHRTFAAGVAIGNSGPRAAAPTPPSPLPVAPPAGAVFRDEVAALERQRILAALEACGGNQSRAARSLGISRATLIRRLEIYGVARPRK